MNADKGLGSGVKVNGVNRTGRGAVSALYAEFPFNNYPTAFALGKAPVGQAKAQGAGLQARQGFASKPVDRPPDDTIRMPAVSQDNLLFTSRAQASEQE